MKFTGRYTAATAKALKGSPRLVCQVTEDGTIYVCPVRAPSGTSTTRLRPS